MEENMEMTMWRLYGGQKCIAEFIPDSHSHNSRANCQPICFGRNTVGQAFLEPLEKKWELVYDIWGLARQTSDKEWHYDHNRNNESLY